MLEDYYELRDWDKETGNPRRERLEEFALEFALSS
jgi:aldehyde:ferredoxin oxidoreductase